MEALEMAFWVSNRNLWIIEKLDFVCVCVFSIIILLPYPFRTVRIRKG